MILGFGVGAHRGGYAPLTISPTSLTTAPLGTQTFTATGGKGPLTFSLHTNNSGGSCDSSGHYVCGAVGSVSDEVRVTDADGKAVAATVTVTAALSISPGSASIAYNGTQTYTASNGSGYVYTSTGVYGSINSSSGVYTANGRGGGTDTITVTDSLGATATATVTVAMWTPAALSNVVLWLDPAQNLTQSGNRVSAWNDSSGSGDTNRNVTQSTSGLRPLYTATDANYNNQPSVKDDDGTRFLVSSPTWGTTYSQPTTFLLAGQCGARLLDGNTGGNRQTILDQASTWAYFGGTTVVAGSVSAPSREACAAVFNGASSHLYVHDATTATANGNPGSNALNTLGVFATSDGLGPGSFDELAELVIVNGIVSDADRKNFFWYCGQKYGLTVTGT